MFSFESLFFLLNCYTVFATPLLRKRLDSDGNGVPDWCSFDSEGTAHCLRSDGTWTAVPSDEQSSYAAGPSKGTATLAPVPPKTTTTSSVPAPLVETTAASSSPAAAPALWSKTSPPSSLPTGTLPSASQFKSDNGTKWKIEYVGDIRYTGDIGTKNLMGDKCRSSQLGNKVIWNCGDMMCPPDYTTCGFAMGPAMYGTDDVMTINTTSINHIHNNDFLNPWTDDPTPQKPHSAWGMDQSNVAPLNDTHGVVYGFEIWRGASDDSFVPRGNAVGIVTLGSEKPIATRMGPLLTGSNAVGMGLLAILRDGNYIYLYAEGGPSRLLVTRVPANDSIFDASKYESLDFGSDSWTSAIPTASDSKYGMTTADKSGLFGCAVYGSVFYSNYLNKFVIICNIFMSYTNMYTSDTPYGPWSEEYGLLNGWTGYGSMAHPMYSPGGSHKELYFSQGPNEKFNMFKITFNY